MSVERTNLLLGRIAEEPITGQCCRSASQSAPIAQAHRVSQTPLASRQANAILPLKEGVEHTTHA